MKELTDHNLITHEETPWAAPCFLVPKPNSTKLRMVIDYRLLNLQTVRDSHPLPNLKDVIILVAQFLYFCIADLISGFWQTLMEAISKLFTGVCTGDTLFTWDRMPFGVRNGPPCF